MPPFWMVPSSTVLLKAAVFELCSRQPGGEPVRERVEGRRAESRKEFVLGRAGGGIAGGKIKSQRVKINCSDCSDSQ